MAAGRKDEENAGEEGDGNFRPAPHRGNREGGDAEINALVCRADASLEDCEQEVTLILLNRKIK